MIENAPSVQRAERVIRKASCLETVAIGSCVQIAGDRDGNVFDVEPVASGDLSESVRAIGIVIAKPTTTTCHVLIHGPTPLGVLEGLTPGASYVVGDDGLLAKPGDANYPGEDDSVQTMGIATAADELVVMSASGSTGDAPSYDVATTSDDGLMSSGDKTKIDLVRAVITEPGGYPYAVDAGDGVIIVDNASAARRIDLEAVANMRGRVEILCVGDADVFPVTLKRAGSETINGIASDFTIRGLTPLATIVKQGSNYRVHVGASIRRDMYAVSNLSSANYWGVAGGVSYLLGNDLMTVIATFRSLSTDITASQFPWQRIKTSATNQGYRFGQANDAGSGYQRGNMTVYTGVSTTTANLVLGSYDTNKWNTLAFRLSVGAGGTYNNTATLSLNGGAPLSTSAISTYVAATSDPACIARIASANSGPAQYELAALMIVEGVAMSDADIAAYHAQVTGSNNFGLNGSETALFVAQDAEANWVERKGGSISLPRVGSPVRTLHSQPVFA